MLRPSRRKSSVTPKPSEFQNNGTWKKCYQSVIKTGGRNRKTVGMTGLFGFRFLFPLGKISVSIAIRVEIWHKTFANMLMFLAHISSIWSSQYQNSIIDCGGIQLKTSYFSFLIFAFSSNIRKRLERFFI